MPTLRAVAVAAAIALMSCAPQRIGLDSAPGAASAPAAVTVTSLHALPGTSTANEVASPPRAPAAEAVDVRGTGIEAYARIARGDDAGARIAFARLASSATSTGTHPAPTRARVIVGPVVGAHVTMHGTTFFEGATGEPFAFSDVHVIRAVAGRDHAWFWLDRAVGIYDARAGRRLDLPGDAFAVDPSRPRAYVLDERCRLLEVALPSGQLVRTLGVVGRPGKTTGPLDPCNTWAYRDAAVTPDGGHLTTRVGRWNLRTGAFSPLPTSSRSSEPAVSRDGRYIARTTSNPASRALGDMTKIVLYDLDAGVARLSPWSTGPLANGDPLTLEADPPRVCIFDYGHYIFHVPSLEPMADDDPHLLPPPVPYSFGAPSCETRIAPSPEVRRATARLASRVCDVTGLPVPLRFCDGIAAP